MNGDCENCRHPARDHFLDGAGDRTGCKLCDCPAYVERDEDEE
jgi:hypothetical protein